MQIAGNNNSCFYRMRQILIIINIWESQSNHAIVILLHGRYTKEIFILFGFCFWQRPDSLAELLNYRKNKSFLDYI